MAHQTMDSLAVPLERLVPELAGMAIEVQGLQLDSRRLQPGDAFLAVAGAQYDGRDFCEAAAAAGAAVILADVGLSDVQRRACGSTPVVEVAELGQRLSEIAAHFYGQPGEHLQLTAVTGTNGKTTVSQLLAQILRRAYGDCGVMGTLGAGLTGAVSEARNTTPDPVSVQAELAAWRESDVGYGVLEVSSHSLVQRRVSAVPFHSAIFTNLSHDHLDYHGDVHSYGMAKSQLFTEFDLHTAIINVDDPFSAALLPLVRPEAKLLTFSITGVAAQVAAHNVRFYDQGLHADIESPWGEGVLHSPLVGAFNLSNLLAALTAACDAGVPLEQVLEQAPHLQAAAGRMESVENLLGLQLIVDYAHTPDALEQALRALRPHCQGRLICVFGCGGDRDATKRPLMGQVASVEADLVIVTSDNPRGEDPQQIIEQVVEQIAHANAAELHTEVDRSRAIAMAVGEAVAGDCILVAGKGHESYQQVGEQRLPFSDVQQLRMAVASRASQ
ncbi:UDP-N-acetylmuramoyl-L-alanyl-D-glutamate--2,6-diaminopimelate ligase [Candidatus Litorirhabdus singularis]|nr:UDP-N-acetylmuramoyl-L-alanyl-D-glutamate--2,6-diaminopimelate ligase [Candidatus Litorirhabdus singularis]